MFSAPIHRFLLLGSLLTVLVAASVNRPSMPAHSAAFIVPRTTAHGRGGLQPEQPVIQHKAGSRTRGVKGVASTIKLQAAAKGAAKKTKKAAKKSSSDVETFKKGDFVSSIAEKTGFTKVESEAALTAVLETLAEQMILDKKITLVGFGTFQAKARAARKGRNPRTGEELDIPASKLPSFTASKSLKNRVNGREE